MTNFHRCGMDFKTSKSSTMLFALNHVKMYYTQDMILFLDLWLVTGYQNQLQKLKESVMCERLAFSAFWFTLISLFLEDDCLQDRIPIILCQTWKILSTTVKYCPFKVHTTAQSGSPLL